MGQIRISMKVTGRVQGVGFRFFTSNCALKKRITGWVRNCSDGAVEMEAQGSAENVDEFRKMVGTGPILARVNNVMVTELPVVAGEKGFAIRH